MNLFVALCTIATLCFIRASALEEQDVEDLDLEMDMELERDLEDYDQDDELEEDYSDLDLGDLKSKPGKNPFCERSFKKRTGWGGQCYTWNEEVGKSCDFIWNDTIPEISEQPICRDSDKHCCVNCDVAKQTTNCRIEGATAWRKCPVGDYRFKTMDSGCSCCGKCIRHKRYCKKSQGRFCVTKNDPVCNNDYCIDNGGKTKSKTCEGKHCSCCIGAANPAGC